MYTCIDSILLGGPAYRILRRGDEITHVNGVNVMTFEKQMVVWHLKQSSRTGYLHLRIKRDDLEGKKKNSKFEPHH